MLVELKNGETLNGILLNCDTWMNLTLKEVVQTDPEGKTFHRLPEVYVRGNNVCLRSVSTLCARFGENPNERTHGCWDGQWMTGRALAG